MANTANQQHRPFRMPHESEAEFNARMAEHAERVEHVSSPAARGPQWQNPNQPRQASELKKVRDNYCEEALAALNGEVQRDPIVAAVIVAQALDRLGEKIIEAAAVSSYKRSP